MKRKIVLLSFLGLLLVSLAGCFTNAVEKIEIVGNFPTEFEIGDELDLASITLKATQNDGNTYEFNGNSSGLTITGFDTTTAGNKTMVLRYEGVSLSINYIVFSAGTTANTSAVLLDLIEQQIGTIRLNGDVYGGLDNVKINYPVTIIGNGKNVVETAKFTTEGNGVITFENVVFKNKVNVNGNVTFVNCEFVVEGLVNGVDCSGATNLTIEDCNFTTNSETDCFNYLVKNTGGVTVIKNTTILCNFWYGVSAGANLYLDNCTITSTLKEDTPIKDNSGASLFNANKQPVAIHANAQKVDNEYTFNYVVRNCTFQNVQNVMRVYMLDYVNDEKFNVIWENNDTSINCNYLVNFSEKCFGSEARLLNAMGQLDAKVRYVIQKNTEITRTDVDTPATILLNDGTNIQYTGLTYTDKNGDQYQYIGFANSKHYLYKDGTYYTITMAYSSDGLDTRTIVEASKPVMFQDVA